jgi:hypothetical protein
MDEEEKRRGRNAVFESIPSHEIIGVMVEMFGLRHTLTLIGWAIRWGVQGIENGPEFRAKLKAEKGEGASRSAVYRASLDYRRFGDELETRYKVPVDSELLYRSVSQSDLAKAMSQYVGQSVL